jgi:hypothetical protein
VSLQKGSWLSVVSGRATTELADRVHALLCEHSLVARGSLSLSICKGSGSGIKGDGKRNDDRSDGGNHRKEQRVTMKNGTGGRFILLTGASIVMASMNSAWT